MEQALQGHRSPVYFDRTYNEAMALLIEARDYAQIACDRGTGAAPADALVVNRESFRLTTRLTQIMSWLLARRAVLNDELTAAQFAATDWRLGAQEICHDESGHGHDAINPRLRDLLRRSHRLYVRVSRLAGGGASDRARAPAWFTPSAREPNF